MWTGRKERFIVDGTLCKEVRSRLDLANDKSQLGRSDNFLAIHSLYFT